MRFRCALILVVLSGCFAATVAQERSESGEPAHTVRVTLATHNVENFFDVFDDPYTSDEESRIKSRELIGRLGATLRRADADFIALQEVENAGILAKFRGWHFPDAGYDYLWTHTMPGTRGIVTGFMSKVPTGTIRIYKYQRLRLPGDEREWTFARDLVSVDLLPAKNVTVELFIVHLKSKRDGEGDPKSAKWRLSEARRVRQIVAERLARDPDALIAVAGDFNDTPGSATLAALLDPDDRGGRALLDPHDALNPARRITYLREPYRETVDYILLSPALARAVVPGSARVIEADEPGSDHAPVVVTVELPTTEARARDKWRWVNPGMVR